jgi:hypothetical protein
LRQIGKAWLEFTVKAVSSGAMRREAVMFTIEHEFDATVITLVDEGGLEPALQEDVTIEAFAECVVLRQVDVSSDQVVSITLSMVQLADLAAALDLPEGSYRIEKTV